MLRGEFKTVFSVPDKGGPVGYGFFYSVIVRINGGEKEVGAGLNVAQLLEHLGVRAGRVVVELNRDVLPRDAHGDTVLKEGDSLEIVHFVGGG